MGLLAPAFTIPKAFPDYGLAFAEKSGFEAEYIKRRHPTVGVATYPPYRGNGATGILKLDRLIEENNKNATKELTRIPALRTAIQIVCLVAGDYRVFNNR